MVPLTATLVTWEGLASCSAGLIVLGLGVLLPGATTNIPLNWKLRHPPGHFGLLMSLNQQAKKAVTVLGGVIDPDTKGKLTASPQWR